MVMISIIGMGYISILGKDVLCPLLFGFLFSILLLPLARYLENKLHFSRGASAFVSVLLMIMFIVGIILLVGAQFSRLMQDLPELIQQVIQSFEEFQQWIARKFHVNMDRQMSYINEATNRLGSFSPAVIGATVVSLSSMLLFLVFIVLDTFFLLLYRKLLIRFLYDVFLEKNASSVNYVVAKVQFIIRNYIVGLFLQMVTVAIVCCTVFLMLGLKYAILLGIITALFNIVPYIGIFTALLVNIIITFATTGLLSNVFWVVLTVGGIHIIDSNILLPFIVGSKVRINAFITLIGVVVGEMIWGISGMFLSIPVIAIAKIIFDRVENLRPWGYLLGDDKKARKPLNFIMKIFRKKAKK